MAQSDGSQRKTWMALLVLTLLSLVVVFIVVWNFPSASNQGYAPEQPIPFSHKLHAGTYNIDCRYCHVAVEKSSHATIPSMNVCMNCHIAVKTDSPHIQKLTELYGKNQPIEWVRIHRLPDHAKFRHNRHVAAGVSCQTCHGPIQEMDRVYQAKALNMGWCLECHRGQTTPLEIRKWKYPDQSGSAATGTAAVDPHGPVAPFNCTTCHY